MAQGSCGFVTAYPRRGEVWWTELPELRRRPAVVLTRDPSIPRMRRALVAPCTTTLRGLDTEVVLEPGDDPVPRVCAVNLDSVECVSTSALVERLGTLSAERMQQLCGALAIAVGCQS